MTTRPVRAAEVPPRIPGNNARPQWSDRRTAGNPVLWLPAGVHGRTSAGRFTETAHPRTSPRASAGTTRCSKAQARSDPHGISGALRRMAFQHPPQPAAEGNGSSGGYFPSGRRANASRWAVWFPDGYSEFRQYMSVCPIFSGRHLAFPLRGSLGRHDPPMRRRPHPPADTQAIPQNPPCRVRRSRMEWDPASDRPGSIAHVGEETAPHQGARLRERAGATEHPNPYPPPRR